MKAGSPNQSWQMLIRRSCLSFSDATSPLPAGSSMSAASIMIIRLPGNRRISRADGQLPQHLQRQRRIADRVDQQLSNSLPQPIEIDCPFLLAGP